MLGISHLPPTPNLRRARELLLAQACNSDQHFVRELATDGRAVAREHGLRERTVVTEFPSLEKATAAYDSAAYAEALKALGDGAVRDFRIVEGVE